MRHHYAHTNMYKYEKYFDLWCAVVKWSPRKFETSDKWWPILNRRAKNCIFSRYTRGGECANCSALDLIYCTECKLKSMVLFSIFWSFGDWTISALPPPLAFQMKKGKERNVFFPMFISFILITCLFVLEIVWNKVYKKSAPTLIKTWGSSCTNWLIYRLACGSRASTGRRCT